MNAIWVVIMVAVVVIIGLMLQRVFQGPTIYDRMNGLGVIGAIGLSIFMRNRITCGLIFISDFTVAFTTSILAFTTSLSSHNQYNASELGGVLF